MSDEENETSVAALTTSEITQRLAAKKLDAAREFVRKAQTRRRTYLSFNGRTPTGAVYLLGAEKKTVPLGTQAVADVDSAECGYVQWEDGEPLDEAMGSLLGGFAPDPSEYPEEGGWELTYRNPAQPDGAGACDMDVFHAHSRRPQSRRGRDRGVGGKGRPRQHADH